MKLMLEYRPAPWWSFLPGRWVILRGEKVLGKMTVWEDFSHILCYRDVLQSLEDKGLLK